MFHIVLYEPEIPPNTGNIMRLCANVGATLHLIHPLGFSLDTKNLRRAGLDYHDLVHVKEYSNYSECLNTLKHFRVFACTTRGQQNYAQITYEPNDVLMFGPETRGLPQTLLDTFSKENRLRIPMQSTTRSLNLSNSVAIVLYEAWRQLSFATGL
jgi:tRNA (cytidine/uridine-2'-O-)-methyltransferase